jgi:hypothetical protein
MDNIFLFVVGIFMIIFYTNRGLRDKGHAARIRDVQPVRVGSHWNLQCTGGERNGDLFLINQ